MKIKCICCQVVILPETHSETFTMRLEHWQYIKIHKHFKDMSAVTSKSKFIFCRARWDVFSAVNVEIWKLKESCMIVNSNELYNQVQRYSLIKYMILNNWRVVRFGGTIVSQFPLTHQKVVSNIKTHFSMLLMSHRNKLKTAAIFTGVLQSSHLLLSVQNDHLYEQ